MADNFVEVPLTTGEQDLADLAIETLQSKWPDWEPNDGDLEVVVIEVLAAITADTTLTASVVPPLIFRAFGEKLMNVPFEVGAPATASLTFTLEDTNGMTIPAGTEVEVDGHVFSTDDDVVTLPGDATATILATATELGTDFNDLTGASMSMVTSLARIASVTLDAPTSGGVDEETEDDYLDRLSLAMELRGITLVTTRDFELMALTQADVARVVAEHLGARQVRVTGVRSDGSNLLTATKDALAALYAEFQMVNVTNEIDDPTRTTVAVIVTVKGYPDFDPAALSAAIQDVLTQLLSPALWGLPTSGDVRSRWYNETTIRVNKLIDRIGDVQGVDYVVSVALAAVGRNVVGSAATDRVTLAGHGFAVDTPVRFTSLTGGGGLNATTTYYVRNVTTNDFQLAAAPGGAAINITSDITAGAIAPWPGANGDLVMPGNVALPQPGPFTVTVT